MRLAARSIKLTWASVAVFSVASVAQLLLQASLIYEVSVIEAVGPLAWATLDETAWGGTVALANGADRAFSSCLRLARAAGGQCLVATGPLFRVLALAAGCGILWTLSLTSHAAATADIRNLAVRRRLCTLSCGGSVGRGAVPTCASVSRFSCASFLHGSGASAWAVLCPDSRLWPG